MTSARKKRSRLKGRRSSVNIWYIVGAVFLVAFTIIFLSLRQSSQVDIGQYGDYPAEWINRNSLGNPAAAVTIQAWDDFL